jgi:hypothetical protein
MSYSDILKYYKSKNYLDEYKFIESMYLKDKKIFNQYIFLCSMIQHSDFDEWVCITNNGLKPNLLKLDTNNKEYFDNYFIFSKNYNKKELKIIHLIAHAFGIITIEKLFFRNNNNNIFDFIFKKIYIEIFCTKNPNKILQINSLSIKEPSFFINISRKISFNNKNIKVYVDKETNYNNNNNNNNLNNNFNNNKYDNNE